VSKHRQELDPDIVVLSGNPDALETAAVSAVIGGVLEELAEEQGRLQAAGTSAWAKSQRAVRKPIHPGHGEWRGFSA
jgi:hypothetical protein